MHFKATVNHQDYTEPTLFEAEMRGQKRNRSRLWKLGHLHHATNNGMYPTWKPRTKPQPSTPEEIEWLGRWVRMRDGGIAQVWSLAEHRGKVHLVAPGMSGNVLIEDHPTSTLREAEVCECGQPATGRVDTGRDWAPVCAEHLAIEYGAGSSVESLF